MQTAVTVLPLLTGLAALGAGPPAPAEPARAFQARLRSRVQPFKNNDAWQAVSVSQQFRTSEAAIVICDMWDKHWCAGASRRVDYLARRMEPLLRQARAAGIFVIHSPSDTMDFYKDYPQRKLVLEAAAIKPPAELAMRDPPLPIDDSDGGCDTPGDKEYRAWTRENPVLSIDPRDAISDNGNEIYNLLRQRGIHTVFIMGVHANMCILNRSFAIRQLSKWGLRCVLVRDLTDAMYNPARKPFVSHAAGTQLVIEHIEKYWCPSVLSADLVAALSGRPAASK